MIVKILSAEDFWEKMCDIKFVRLTYLTGKILDELYICLSPPEENGIIEKALEDIKCHLKP